MSKAMDTLDRVAQYVAGWKHSIAIGEQLSLLRDYIMMMEAELENSRDVIEEFGAHVEIGSIGHFSATDAIDGIDRPSGMTRRPPASRS